MSQPPPWPPQPGPYGAPQGNPYGQPPGNYYGAPLRSVNSGLILTLGILSLLLCNLLGPFAAIMGGNAVGAIDRGEASPTERPSANAGRIMGIIGSVLLGFTVLLVFVAIASPDFRQGFMKGFNQSYNRQYAPQGSDPSTLPSSQPDPNQSQPAPAPSAPTVPPQ